MRDGTVVDLDLLLVPALAVILDQEFGAAGAGPYCTNSLSLRLQGRLAHAHSPGLARKLAQLARTRQIADLVHGGSGVAVISSTGNLGHRGCSRDGKGASNGALTLALTLALSLPVTTVTRRAGPLTGPLSATHHLVLMITLSR